MILPCVWRAYSVQSDGEVEWHCGWTGCDGVAFTDAEQPRAPEPFNEGENTRCEEES